MNPNDPIIKLGDDFKFGGLATGGYSPGQEPPVRGSAQTQPYETPISPSLRFEREARMNAEEEVREARELLSRWVTHQPDSQLVDETEEFLS